MAAYSWATLAYAAIGSAVSTAVNGGTFGSFAIGMGIGLAAGCISNAMGASLFGKTGWESFISDPIGKFVYAALQGSISGAISSAFYGQNIWKGMAQGALGGVIGVGVAIATEAAISFGASVIEDLGGTSGSGGQFMAATFTAGGYTTDIDGVTYMYGPNGGIYDFPVHTTLDGCLSVDMLEITIDETGERIPVAMVDGNVMLNDRIINAVIRPTIHRINQWWRVPAIWKLEHHELLARCS